MANCVMCVASIPEGETICSMCYGDIDYGKDNYYREWIEDLDKEEQNDYEDK